ncbi:MAG TPA: DUF1003 domain-containing protein [Vicinamibacterales bacterium]|jgi:uncharacterized membrane protein/uncharacterized membrane protein YeaQ/YmgE (transglycosylase-associated protein family)
MHSVIWIASALIAGILARIVMKSRGRGFIADTALGALGSVSGAWLLRIVEGEIPANGIAHLATALIGAVCLVAAGRLVVSAAQRAARLAPEGAVALNLPDLESQFRKLTALEQSVLSRILRREGLPRDPNESFQQQQTFGERIADRVATFGGSWTFLGCFAAFMLAWMFVNTATSRPVDPYPFILLNLVLSCLAAVQAPIIMMSQNRQSARDRFDAQQDYQVNLRAEVQISELHAKLDAARTADLHELLLLQRQQLAVLERIERDVARSGR